MGGSSEAPAPSTTPRTAPFGAAVSRARAGAAQVRYAAAAGGVAATFLAMQALGRALPLDEHPLTPFLAPVLLAATLYGRGCGFFALALCLPLVSYFYLPPVGSFALHEAEAVAIAVFVALGSAMVLVVEAFAAAAADLRREAAGLRRALAERAGAERARALLLREFRHRARNDMTALVGLLALRARAAPSDAARDALLEAADDARALARVQARLAGDGDGGGALLDTRGFVAGLCADLQAAQAGEGLRPVALVAEAEAHALDAGRAVPLGLVLNEAVTNALKHAFPDERAGTVGVRFAREGAEFVLVVSDDGVGLPEPGPGPGPPPAASSPKRGPGQGTGLLRALAAQLRGCVARRPGEGGAGTVVELRFPAGAPGQPAR